MKLTKVFHLVDFPPQDKIKDCCCGILIVCYY